ncbi:DUF5392 family protein [Bacillus sp. JCM 19034]|uniref:DUF5392 family protein n=1 Tax=Bacillus sp. JCM 19034 TaxID=1481928 RepID=UPI0007826928|nr:DUF5392 family protein [Bacillus sp. JCM 19034]
MLSFKVNEKYSTYISKELVKIQSEVKPFIRKSSIYTFISIPLITFSTLYLGIIFFQLGIRQELLLVVLLAAIAGSLGLALFKESMHINKETVSKSIEYMSNRILKSSLISESSKDRYLDQLHSDPVRGLNTFCQFLEQEERVKKMEESKIGK